MLPWEKEAQKQEIYKYSRMVWERCEERRKLWRRPPAETTTEMEDDWYRRGQYNQLQEKIRTSWEEIQTSILAIIQLHPAHTEHARRERGDLWRYTGKMLEDIEYFRKQTWEYEPEKETIRKTTGGQKRARASGRYGPYEIQTTAFFPDNTREEAHHGLGEMEGGHVLAPCPGALHNVGKPYVGLSVWIPELRAP